MKPGASEWATAKAPSSAYGFVSATLTGDGASVRITKGKDGFFDSETYRKSFGFSYDTEYPIAGCYGDYQDIFVGVCGQELYPYAFLLTKGNTVEYADIFGGLGGKSLCCGGPLYGLRDIVRFESGICADEHGGGYETVYAVDKSGAKYDLAQRIVPMSSTMSTGVTGDWYADVHHGGEAAATRIAMRFPSKATASPISKIPWRGWMTPSHTAATAPIWVRRSRGCSIASSSAAATAPATQPSPSPSTSPIAGTAR